MPLRNYRSLLLAPLLVLQCATVASAQSNASSSAGSLNKSPGAVDVAETPLRDVNLKKTKIPPVLERAAAAPYTLNGLNSCGRLVAQVRLLNSVLGEDIDEEHARGHAITAGRLAQSVVDSLIPFSGIIREVSGASAEQRRLQAAVAAGFARRGFLKGVGLSRHCPAPARPV
jgi:hypothetical protein